MSSSASVRDRVRLQSVSALYSTVITGPALSSLCPHCHYCVHVVIIVSTFSWLCLHCNFCVRSIMIVLALSLSKPTRIQFVREYLCGNESYVKLLEHIHKRYSINRHCSFYSTYRNFIGWKIRIWSLSHIPKNINS